jgi:hypothetical protein
MDQFCAFHIAASFSQVGTSLTQIMGQSTAILPFNMKANLMNRVAIKANRGKLYKDPMLFAITDMTSE